MTIEQPLSAPYAAPPQLPPPVGAYPVASAAALAVPVAPVKEQTRGGLQVRWDGTVLAPSSVMNAVYLMWAGAGLALVTGVVSALRAEAVMAEALAVPELAADPRIAEVFLTSAKVAGFVGALVSAALWMWMASANGKGKGWARVLASVGYGFTLLGLLVTALAAPTGGLVDLLLGLPGFAVGTAAVVLLWLPASSRYYAAVRAVRRA